MPGLARAKELREERASLKADMDEMLDMIEQEDRDFTADEEKKWERLHERQEELQSRAQRIIDHDRLWRDWDPEKESAGRSPAATPDADPAGGGEGRAEGGAEGADRERRHEAMRQYLRYGVNGMDPELRQVAVQSINGLTPEQRALAAGTNASGGFTVPEDSSLMNTVVEALQAFGGMRQVAEVIETDNGRDLPIPSDNDTSNTGELLSENTQAAEQDITFAQTTLNAFMYSSKIVRVSIQLLQDTAIDIETYLGRKLGQRIGRITNTHFTTGDASSKPNGVVTAATSAVTGTAVADISLDELYDLEHSVDPAYRSRQDQPETVTRWMFSDDTLKKFKQMKDGEGRPLWVPGIAIGEPDTIDGYQYVVNQDVADMASSAKSVLFGNFFLYKIRDVREMMILRLEERYADYLQVGFLAFRRHDGDLVDAGTNPIKYFQNAA